MEEKENDWPTFDQMYRVQTIANTIDPVSRTFGFQLPLTNPSRAVTRDGRIVLLWRFRPGQKVRLHVRVEKLDHVFVLPTDAVTREGADAYVFRQNGVLYERKPIRVIHQNRQHVVIANDGSVSPGIFIAQSAATQLNRVLKGQGGTTPSGVHVHADGSVHQNH